MSIVIIDRKGSLAGEITPCIHESAICYSTNSENRTITDTYFVKGTQGLTFELFTESHLDEYHDIIHKVPTTALFTNKKFDYNTIELYYDEDGVKYPIRIPIIQCRFNIADILIFTSVPERCEEQLGAFNFKLYGRALVQTEIVNTKYCMTENTQTLAGLYQIMDTNISDYSIKRRIVMRNYNLLCNVFGNRSLVGSPTFHSHIERIVLHDNFLRRTFSCCNKKQFQRYCIYVDIGQGNNYIRSVLESIYNSITELSHQMITIIPMKVNQLTNTGNTESEDTF